MAKPSWTRLTIEALPLANAPLLGNALGWAAVAVILGTTVYVLWRRQRVLNERDAFLYNFALTVPAMLLVIPLSWDHYEPHLLLPLAVAGLYRTAKPTPKILFALACLCLALHRFWNVWLFESPFAWFALLWNPARDAARGA